jgi:hypothetical protein
VTNSVDIKLSVHDAPPEQSALDTLKIERLDRQATQKFLQSYTTNNLCIYLGGSNPFFLALACIASQLTQLHVHCQENKTQFLLNIFLVQY